MITLLHPAICAGIASISTVLTSGAEPPGTYRPTLSMAWVCSSQVIPGWVCTTTGAVFCCSWKALIFSFA